ncbi:Similar to hypothetical protein VDAG_07050 [Verticillium dahliae VdLs.17]; acc. no. EGY15886 [Pyronema omphalodes CBS 100304]|uniref:Uncharacterized protein n=1 Tax=Pyronema omphalodes (strain CBS 100304) TaxID=1076935 RepID=U4KXP0_PYROM|nr:Similar to hypothetical protein VDAG_07050 [Verticillium dahliae VdLs.17]; acc. no. EGY15886 [Pyronema omphalodes CBS 100304]
MRLKLTIPTRSLLRHTPQTRAISHLHFHRSSLSITNLQAVTASITNTIPITTTTTTRLFSTTTPTNMSSDADYMAFLQKQQQRAEALAATTTIGDLGEKEVKVLGTGEEPHSAIRNLLNTDVEKSYYSSGLEIEEFKDITLEWGKEEMPTEDEFATLLSTGPVTKEPFSSWDPRGNYKETEIAIKKASGADEVSVYRVSREGARYEYFVLAKVVKSPRLVGVRFKAIEDVDDE